MQLKIYQEEAIDDLLDKAKKLLKMEYGKKLVFKAPTGSGKTIMMAEFLKQLVDDKEVKQSLSFIWAAPHKLHIQSKDKLESYFETSRTLECKFFEDLGDKKINENEILFFNWESINKTNSIYIRDNEQEFNLSKVLERTKEDGRKIILIIDESHFFAGAKDDKEKQVANKLRNDINPDLTIEVSATPILKNVNETVTVQIEDVKKEGMIKKAVIVNDGFDKIIKNGKIHTEKLSDKKIKDSEELVIAVAMKKRNELVQAYKKEGVEINPLVAIQLPRRIGQTEDRMREKIESILKSKFNISKEKGNNKLAIWLSEEHINKEDIEKLDSPVEVLIFKEAIAYGWDCPRAQILVLFREWHSQIFSIQTVGRIMRMPEPDKGYYGSKVLNYGYVYTNLDNIEIHEDIDRGYITVYTNKRQADYKNINLSSYYSKRHREKTRLSPRFIEIFLAQAKEDSLKSKIDKTAKRVDIKIISDYKASDIDTLVGSKIVGDKSIAVSDADLQKLFDYFVRNSLRFYPEDRSVNRVKESIYKFFEKELKMDYSEKWEEIVKIVLGDNNTQRFLNVLDKAQVEYKNETEIREGELAKLDNWNVPEVLSFGSDYAEEAKDRSVMKPFYVKYLSELEKSFAEFLDDSGKVEWWFKNGDRDATFFAVSYDEDKTPFYVDFVVKFKDGRIGLFDPHGTQFSDFGPKSDGLQKYIKEENKKGKKLFGGLVANTGTTTNNGRWVYFTDSGAKFKKGEFGNWTDLDL